MKINHKTIICCLLFIVFGGTLYSCSYNKRFKQEPLAPVVEQKAVPDKNLAKPENKISEPAPEIVKEKIQSMDDFIDSWAGAWSKKNFDGYISCYADEFIPSKGVSQAEWRKHRKKMLELPNNIEIGIELNKKEIISPDRIKLTFSQRYKSDSYSDMVIKTFDLILKDGKWKIIKEDAQAIK